MRLVSVQVGKPEQRGSEGATDRLERPWRTGYGKRPVAGPVFCSALNLAGDGQADKRWHGGPEMAILAYSADHYPLWRAELAWPEIGPGAFAENLTVEGADEDSVCIGDVWEVGSARLQVSEPRKPCNNISKFHHRKDLLQRVIDTGRIGWYLRVLREGTLEAGQQVRLAQRLRSDWPVARAMEARMAKKKDPVRARQLAALPELGSDWRELILEGLGEGAVESIKP